MGLSNAGFWTKIGQSALNIAAISLVWITLWEFAFAAAFVASLEGRDQYGVCFFFRLSTSSNWDVRFGISRLPEGSKLATFFPLRWLMIHPVSQSAACRHRKATFSKFLLIKFLVLSRYTTSWALELYMRIGAVTCTGRVMLSSSILLSTTQPNIAEVPGGLWPVCFTFRKANLNRVVFVFFVYIHFYEVCVFLDCDFA